MLDRPPAASRHLKAINPVAMGKVGFGKIEGVDLGAAVTILFFSTDEQGKGPPLHTHTYDEFFIIRSGKARFTVGNQVFIAKSGDVVFGPANIPHKFNALGPERFETIDIHVSDHFEQEELE